MLIVVSGPDRVGKSTLISRMQEACGNDAYVAHHSAPPKNQKNIFDFYKDDIEAWLSSSKKIAIFDRAWPCSFILEQHRRRNFGHLEDLVDFEIWLNDKVGAVVHLGAFCFQKTDPQRFHNGPMFSKSSARTTPRASFQVEVRWRHR